MDDQRVRRVGGIRVVDFRGNERQELVGGPGMRRGRGEFSPFLKPRGEGLVFDSVDLREARAAQAAGLIGLDQCGFLFGGVAQPTAPVGFHDGIVHSIHRGCHYECYAVAAATMDQRRYGPRLHNNRDLRIFFKQEGA